MSEMPFYTSNIGQVNWAESHSNVFEIYIEFTEEKEGDGVRELFVWETKIVCRYANNNNNNPNTYNYEHQHFTVLSIYTYSKFIHHRIFGLIGAAAHTVLTTMPADA